MGLLLLLLKKKTGSVDEKNLLLSFGKIILASAVMAGTVYFAAWGCESILGTTGKLAQCIELAVSIGIGAVVYAFITIGLKMDEADMVKGVLLRKFKRRRKAVAR